MPRPVEHLKFTPGWLLSQPHRPFRDNRVSALHISEEASKLSGPRSVHVLPEERIPVDEQITGPEKIHEFVIVHVPAEKDWKEPLYLLDRSSPRFSLIIHRRHLVGGIEKVRQRCLWVLRLESEKWSK